MKSVYNRVTRPMADSDPEPPQPVPFPIRIVKDPPPPPSDTMSIASQPSVSKRTDCFYEAWDKFLAIEPKRAKSTSKIVKKTKEQQQNVDQSPGDGLQVKGNASSSWEHAVAECKAKVAAIVAESKRLNQKYRDALFDLEARNSGCLTNLIGKYPNAINEIDTPPWIKRVEDIFDDPQFFIDGASAQDVHQGSSGDCWFLAALMAVSAKPGLIEDLCVARDERVGVYGFVFYRDGEWIYEVIDDKLFLRVGDDDDLRVVRDWDKEKKDGLALVHDEEKLKETLQRGGEALYFSHCKSNETWLPLIEKCYAKVHGDYSALEGGYAGEAIEDLTGGVGVAINPEDIMDKERFWREQLSQVNEKYLFGGGSRSSPSKGVLAGHAYGVLETFEEGDLKLLKLRNPWGRTEWEGDWSDGSKLWTPDMMKKLKHQFGDDGIFWMSYKDFLNHFPIISKVRLFDKNWQVAQQWTSVNVPWTVDYLDTKFQFTITKQCPVVIALSQPDDRYFFGLRGRFLYALHFRVHKEGEDKYIVRSMHNSGGETDFTRSVSADIEDLEPGTYNVIFKITATRKQRGLTPEQAILAYAVDKKEKLLNVGRRFDYAMAKGNLRAMEEANKRRQDQDEKDKMKIERKGARRRMQMERERARKRKKRVEDAMRDKRKEYREKVRQAERPFKSKKEDDSIEAQASAVAKETSDCKASITPRTEDSPSQEVASEDAHAGRETPAAEHLPEKEAATTKTEDKAPDSNEGGEDLAKPFAELDISGTRTSSVSPISPLEDDGYQSPEQLEDVDFDWDSDIDGPPDSSDEDDLMTRNSASGSANEIFSNDPWNAVCVLGLRVYSLNADAKISVIKGENDS